VDIWNDSLNNMELTAFHYFLGFTALFMLIYNTIEVGRNDAANIVNAVFGAKALDAKRAILLAGLAVIVGAVAASPVMETARKGIFDPSSLGNLQSAINVYLAVYVTNTVLLYSFSAFGMPVSTTACLVFALLGGGFAVGGMDAIDWQKSSQVILGIICSILASGFLGYMVQRLFRYFIKGDCRSDASVQRHGAWISGLLITGLIYFMIMKGLKNVAFVKVIKASFFAKLGTPVALLCLWGLFTLVIGVAMVAWKQRLKTYLFASLAILGMISTAIAFGQNDLANCASPGLAILMILKHGTLATQVDVAWWMLFGCGILLFLGMSTKTARRVTEAGVRAGSQGGNVRLYAPKWCLSLANCLVAKEASTAPQTKAKDSLDEGFHFDALRAAVITSVTGSVIAVASGLGLPVSTTYVSFAAVISTGWADRIFHTGDAVVKMGRTIWVVFCWFFSAFIAALATAIMLHIISFAWWGILLALGVNLAIRQIMQRRSDVHEQRVNG